MRFLRICLLCLVLALPLSASAFSLRRADLLHHLCSAYFEPRYVQSFADAVPIFPDMRRDDPLRGCVAAAHASGMIDGPPLRRTFDAAAPATFAQALKMIAAFQRADLSPWTRSAFPGDPWYLPHQQWAHVRGFDVPHPDAPLTASDLASMLAALSSTSLPDPFADIQSVTSDDALVFGQRIVSSMQLSPLLGDHH